MTGRKKNLNSAVHRFLSLLSMPFDPSRRLKWTVAFSAAGVLCLLAVGTAFLIWSAEAKLSRMVLGGLGESFSTRIYSKPFLLDPETRLSPEHFLERLDRLGYSRVSSLPAQRGEYEWSSPHLTAYLRGFKTPQAVQEPVLATFTWSPGNRWVLQTFAGAPLGRVILEPEVLSEVSGPKEIRRQPAGWEEFPETLKKAVLAAEDKRFFRHWGLDPRAILRSAFRNVVGDSLQGGSTITQQLAKNFFLTPERTWKRKAAEALLALYLEVRFSKEEILTRYMNHVYLGQEGTVSVAGFKAAAQFYFGKDMGDLEKGECAFLAGIIRSPHRYNPWRDPAAAQNRRNRILARMHEEGMISEEESTRAALLPLRVRPLSEAGGRKEESAWCVAETLRELAPRFEETELLRYGLGIHTTVDPLLQKAAHGALKAVKHQGALVALEARSGAILALEGGKDFSSSQFNRATQALRQPGSAFKPFVYGAALENGWTPASVLRDTPRRYPKGPSGTWRPRNFNGVYLGSVTFRTSLAQSLNSATLDLAGRLGPDKILSFARRLGIKSPLEASLATALGASEVGLLELAAAYAPFANGGFRIQPHLITAVTDADGNLLETGEGGKEPVISPALAYLMTSLMESAVREGTAKNLGRLGWDRPSAGKTGTTNEGADAWFIGYTPELLSGIWVGDDRRRPSKLSGGKDAVPVWAAFMKEALADVPPEPFMPPSGVVKAVIDPLSGQLAVYGCPERREELFLEGTQPTGDCPLHSRGVVGWLKKLFRKK